MTPAVFRAFSEELTKFAKTRSVQEWQRAVAGGDQATADAIAHGSGSLGLKPRYVRDISGGGAEAGVDLMMGHATPSSAPAPTAQARLEAYKARKANLGLEGRAPSPSVMSSPAGRGLLVGQQPQMATPAPNEGGYLARKLYKPDSPMHRAEFTPEVLKMKQEYTDHARALSPEAEALVPKMHGYKALHTEKGPELQRAISHHEYLPGVGEFQGSLSDVKKHVLGPMEQKGMAMLDVANNPGNLVHTSRGGKIVDFLPVAGGKLQGSPVSSSANRYFGGLEHVKDVSVFRKAKDLGRLRREVFNPVMRILPRAV